MPPRSRRSPSNRLAGDMEAVEHVQGLPSVLGGEPLEEALEDLALVLLADLQQPPTGVQLIRGGEVALADRPAPSSTRSAVTPFRLIRAQFQSTTIPAARCIVSQALPKMRAVSCHERRLAQLAKNQPKAFVESCLPWAHGRFSTLGVPERGQAAWRMAQTNGVGRPSTRTNWKSRVSKRSWPSSRRPEVKQVDFQVAVTSLSRRRRQSP